MIVTWLVALSETMNLLTWVLAFSASIAAEMLAAVSSTMTWAGVVPLAWKSSPSTVESAAAWATEIVTSCVALSETMILSTWLLALSALTAAEMFAAVSETATWAAVVPSARKSSPSTAVSAAACATVTVTSCVALSETMILSTWVLALSASIAPEMFEAESETATWAGVVPLARKSSPSAALSDAACAAVIVTSCVALSETMILSTRLLTFSALKAAEMFAAVSDTATLAGTMPPDWKSSAMAVVSAATCATLIVTSAEPLLETMILSTWLLAFNASKAPEMLAAVSETATWAGVVPFAWNSSPSTAESAAAWAAVIVTSLVALSLTMILSTWLLALSASIAPATFAAVSETATWAGVVPLAWNSSPRTVESAAACAAVIVTSWVALSETMILSTWVLALSALIAAEMFAAVSETATWAGVVPFDRNNSFSAAVSAAACAAVIVTSEGLLLTMILSTCVLAFSASKAPEMAAALSSTATWAGVVPLARNSSPSTVESAAACDAVIVTSLVALSVTMILLTRLLKLRLPIWAAIAAAVSATMTWTGEAFWLVISPMTVLSINSWTTETVISWLSEMTTAVTWPFDCRASRLAVTFAAVSETWME